MNRIAAGSAHPLAVAGPVGWLLVLSVLAALLASIGRQRERRATAGLLAAAAVGAALPWSLAQGAARLLAGAPEFARVSIGAGAWVVAAGAAVVAFAAVRTGPPTWARAAAATLAIAGWASAAALGGLGRLSLAREYAAQAPAFWAAVGTHLAVVGISLAIAVAIGVPLGVAAARVGWVRSAVLGTAGVIQTVPSLALLGLLVLPLSAVGLPGIGALPGVIALTLYSLLPIVRNTYVGLASVDPAVTDAGRGMGMSRAQLLLRIEAPLALPLVIEGVRAAAVSIIGIAAVVAFVGVGTLGVLVFLGWGQQADDLILLGALPMVLLAIVADAGLRQLARWAVSPGLRSVEG